MEKLSARKEIVSKLIEDLNKGIESIKSLNADIVKQQRYEEVAQNRDFQRKIIAFRDELNQFLYNLETNKSEKLPHYQKLVDEIFAKGDLWKHRTLRTVFDPHATEYSNTSPEQKAKIMSKILTADFPFEILVDQYKQFYRELGKPYVAKDFEKGLLALIDKKLMEEVCWI